MDHFIFPKLGNYMFSISIFCGSRLLEHFTTFCQCCLFKTKPSFVLHRYLQVSYSFSAIIQGHSPALHCRPRAHTHFSSLTDLSKPLFFSYDSFTRHLHPHSLIPHKCSYNNTKFRQRIQSFRHQDMILRNSVNYIGSCLKKLYTIQQNSLKKQSYFYSQKTQ